MHGNCLFQNITKPTRYRANTTANTLDLVFTNEEGMVARWYWIFSYLLLVPVTMYVSGLIYCATLAIVRSVDLNIICIRLILIQWGSCFRKLIGMIIWVLCMDIHSAWQFFATKFTNIINECWFLFILLGKRKIFMLLIKYFI